jgi:glycosyltransferase involved in cell wall biosynthesis
MRILITNLFMANYSGTETVVEMLADGLRHSGHSPMILAPTLGPQADAMRARGHVVVDRVAALPAMPDLIHAQHTPVALSAFAAFPDVPAVFSCHSPLFEVEAPRPHPQIRRWIAVDELCRERCLSRGVPAEHLTVIPNTVDLHRFARRPPLPSRPTRALLLTKNHEHQAAVRAVSLEHRLPLDELGPATGRFSTRIEQDLVNYDLVFATERMALEAAAVGCAVIVCDGRGFAGLLTSTDLPSWRRLNFGTGLFTAQTTPVTLRDAIARYDADDAAIVTDRLRAEASADTSIARHLAIYAAALADPGPRDAAARAAATAAWIEDLVPSAVTRDWQMVAREIFRVHAAPPPEFMLAMEQRLREAIQQQGAATRDAVSGLTLLDAFRVLWWRFVPRTVREPMYRARGRLPRIRRGS